jgi:hypothetical protein
MLNLGTVRPGSTIYIPFDSFAGATGASITMSGLATTDILVYKNGSTTERASQTGYTLLDTDGIDFDGKTGIHGFSIDLSSNADAGFYVAGARYMIVVSSITVDGQTVSFVAATFEIGYPDAMINTTIATLSTQTSFTLTAGPAEDNALNGCAVIIHDIASAVQLGMGLITAYTGSTKTVTLAAGVSFTAAAGDNISILRPVLLPTTLGRTLDVSSGGEAGLDWANIGSPTSSQPDVNVEKWNATAVPAEHTAGYPIVTIKDGTGTGEIDTNAGAVVNVTTVTNLTNAPTNGDLTATMKASVNAEVVDVLRTDTIPDSYSTDGSQPTIAQAVMAILQFLTEKAVSGTTVTVKKPDGSTTAMTFTLDSSTDPTSITRAS